LACHTAQPDHAYQPNQISQHYLYRSASVIVLAKWWNNTDQLAVDQPNAAPDQPVDQLLGHSINCT